MCHPYSCIQCHSYTMHSWASPVARKSQWSDKSVKIAQVIKSFKITIVSLRAIHRSIDRNCWPSYSWSTFWLHYSQNMRQTKWSHKEKPFKLLIRASCTVKRLQEL